MPSSMQVSNNINDRLITFASLSVFVAFMVNFYFPSFNNIFDQAGRTGFLIYSLVMFGLVGLSIVIIRSRLAPVLTIYLLLFLIMAVDILLTAYLSHQLSIRDLFELFRPLLFFLFIWFGYELARILPKPEEKVVNLILAMMIIMIIVALTLYFSPRGIREAIWGFYIKANLVASNRVAGTFVNPYDFVLLASLVLTYSYIKFIEHGYVKHALIGLLVCVSIILSQSKIGFILILAALFFSNILLFDSLMRRRNEGFYKWLRFFTLPFLFIILIAIAFIYYADELAYLVNGLSKLLEGGDKSTQIRADQIQLGLEIWTQSLRNLIFGAGAMKNAGLNFENLYILYLVRHGLVGLLILTFIIAVPLTISFRLWLQDRSVYRLVILIFFILSAVAGISNNNIDQMRISFVYYVFLGLCLQRAVASKVKDSEGMEGRFAHG